MVNKDSHKQDITICILLVCQLCSVAAQFVAKKNIVTAIRSWSASCSTLACCQHNRQWLLTTGYDGRAVVWHQSRTGGRINIWTCFFQFKTKISPGSSGRLPECGNSQRFQLLYSVPQ